MATKTKSKADQTLHIYTRVSTAVQADKGTSLDSQLALGKKKAKELKFEFEHWNEGGKSSHHEEIQGRPVLYELFQAIKAGQVKHLWVYDQSRLSRNDQVASGRCPELSCRFESVDMIIMRPFWLVGLRDVGLLSRFSGRHSRVIS